MPVRFTAYDGSSGRRPGRATIGLELRNERGLAYLLTAPGDLGLARAYVAGDLLSTACTRATPTTALVLLHEPPAASAGRRRPRRRDLLRGLGLSNLRPPPPPPQEHLPRWRRAVEGLRHSMARDAEVISHHYDVSNRSTSSSSARR